jgi:hypothetical protein
MLVSITQRKCTIIIVIVKRHLIEKFVLRFMSTGSIWMADLISVSCARGLYCFSHLQFHYQKIGRRLAD